MKKAFAFILLGFLLLSSCEKENWQDTVVGYYTGMHFERTGAGSLEFDLYKTVTEGKLKAHISYYDFKEADKDVILEQNIETVALFNAFYSSLDNKNNIEGDYIPTDLPTGTWANVYFELDTGLIEVTNIELRDSLLQFEVLVKDKAELE